MSRTHKITLPPKDATRYTGVTNESVKETGFLEIAYEKQIPQQEYENIFGGNENVR